MGVIEVDMFSNDVDSAEHPMAESFEYPSQFLFR